MPNSKGRNAGDAADEAQERSEELHKPEPTKADTCGTCNGARVVEGSDCKTCGGTGYVEVSSGALFEKAREAFAGVGVLLARGDWDAWTQDEKDAAWTWIGATIVGEKARKPKHVAKLTKPAKVKGKPDAARSPAVDHMVDATKGGSEPQRNAWPADGGAKPDPALLKGEPPPAVQNSPLLELARKLTTGDRHYVPVKESVPVRLDDAERNESAREAASLHAELTRQEAEFDVIKKQWAKTLTSLKSRISAATREANEGEAVRKVEGLRCFDVKTKRTWIEYRGQAYAERAMSYDETKAFESRALFGDPHVPGTTPADPPAPLKGEAHPVDAETTRVAKDEGPATDPPKPKAKRAAKPKLEVVSAFNAGAAEDAAANAFGKTTKQDIRDVMRDEKSVRGKADHLS